MRVVFLSGMLLALSSGAMAGTLITLDQSVGGAPPKPQFMYIEPEKLRMTSPESDMIYRGDQNKVWIIRAREHSYIELTPESMAQMRAKMDASVAELRQRMTTMSPEERKQAEVFLAARGVGPNAAAGPQIAYEKAGEAKKVGDWKCIPYRVTMNGGPASDFCIASLSDLGLTPDELKPFVDFGAFMSRMGGTGAQRSPMASVNFDEMRKSIGYDGFPVQTAHKSPDGAHDVETTLKAIQHQDAPAGSFDPPAGYDRMDAGARPHN
jgi:hypothetical protein